MANANPRFFIRSTLGSYFSSMIVFAFLHIGSFCQHLLPEKYTGPGPELYDYLIDPEEHRIKTVYMILLAVHLFEASFAVRTAMHKGVTDVFTLLKWFLQTMIVGIFSLKLIRAYDPKKKV